MLLSISQSTIRLQVFILHGLQLQPYLVEILPLLRKDLVQALLQDGLWISTRARLLHHLLLLFHLLAPVVHLDLSLSGLLHLTLPNFSNKCLNHRLQLLKSPCLQLGSIN